MTDGDHHLEPRTVFHVSYHGSLTILTGWFLDRGRHLFKNLPSAASTPDMAFPPNRQSPGHTATSLCSVFLTILYISVIEAFDAVSLRW